MIFILADDLGYGDLGSFGQKLIRTPHLDALTASGMKFTSFYSGTSVCAPSRSALMTGQHTGHTPIRGNKGMKPEGQFPLKNPAYTVAELFRDAGYVTGDFGKWGLGFPGSEGEPLKQGFSEFFGYNCQSIAHDYFPDHLWENNKRVELPNTQTDKKVYTGDLIQSKALAFIEKNKAKPFFAFLSYTLPHAELQLPANDPVMKQYIEAFHEQARPVKPQPGDADPGVYEPQAYPHAAYAAMVTRLDTYVGEVVAKLKALGIDKNTLIIFSSDNGPHREGGNEPEFFNSSGGFRGIKRDLYEGGIREPTIMSWPAVIKPGSTSAFTGAFWDMMPTFAEIIGVKAPASIDGISILPTLKGQPTVQKQHEFLYWEFHENGGRQAVRMGNWKGIRLNAMSDPDRPIELYDLAADPAETNDLARSNPEIVKKLSAILKREHTENPDFPFFSKKK
ncbi:arylsulfatase [Hufsiella ginkgonis]|uniref:arylsulfatase n=1 Tax=Hufsiella ginkgonis TaxID=2695274 RepID=UPI0034E20F1E